MGKFEDKIKEQELKVKELDEQVRNLDYRIRGRQAWLVALQVRLQEREEFFNNRESVLKEKKSIYLKHKIFKVIKNLPIILMISSIIVCFVIFSSFVLPISAFLSFADFFFVNSVGSLLVGIISGVSLGTIISKICQKSIRKSEYQKEAFDERYLDIIREYQQTGDLEFSKKIEECKQSELNEKAKIKKSQEDRGSISENLSLEKGKLDSFISIREKAIKRLLEDEVNKGTFDYILKNQNSSKELGLNNDEVMTGKSVGADSYHPCTLECNAPQLTKKLNNSGQ